MKLDKLFEGLRDPEDNPCWKGYKPVGTKKKGGKTVPNCVPEADQCLDTPDAQRLHDKDVNYFKGAKKVTEREHSGMSREELERELAQLDSMMGESIQEASSDNPKGSPENVFTYKGNDPELRKLKFRTRASDAIATNDLEAMLKWLLKHHKTNAAYLKKVEKDNDDQEQEITDLEIKNATSQQELDQLEKENNAAEIELARQRNQDTKQQKAIKQLTDLMIKHHGNQNINKLTRIGESIRRLNESRHYSYEGWTYETDTEEEDDNIKLWHYAVKGNKRIDIDYTPYAYLSPERFRNFIDNGHPEVRGKTGAMLDDEFDQTFPPANLDENTDDEKAMLAYIQRLVDQDSDDAYDAIRDFYGMYGYRPSIYKTNPRHSYRSSYQTAAKPKMTHLHYFNGVDDQTAAAYKMKKDRNGNWYLPQYNTSGRGFDRTATSLTLSYGAPRTVKLKESSALQEADIKQGFDNMKAVLKAVQSSSNTIIQLDDGEPMDIEYPFARFIGGFYKQAVKDGRQEEFMKKMNSAAFLDYLKDYWMHKMTKVARNEI